MLREKVQKLVDLGVTRMSISKYTGISDNMIGKWLRGQRNLSETNEIKVQEWLDYFKGEVNNI